MDRPDAQTGIDAAAHSGKTSDPNSAKWIKTQRWPLGTSAASRTRLALCAHWRCEANRPGGCCACALAHRPYSGGDCDPLAQSNPSRTGQLRGDLGCGNSAQVRSMSSSDGRKCRFGCAKRFVLIAAGRIGWPIAARMFGQILRLARSLHRSSTRSLLARSKTTRPVQNVSAPAASRPMSTGTDGATSEYSTLWTPLTYHDMGFA